MPITLPNVEILFVHLTCSQCHPGKSIVDSGRAKKEKTGEEKRREGEDKKKMLCQCI